ncbi:MAG: glycoside hydrolase family 2 TIM barrel-domain containing protein, partial [Eubacteriales bacterium]
MPVMSTAAAAVKETVSLETVERADENLTNENGLSRLAADATVVRAAYVPEPFTFNDKEWTGLDGSSGVFALGKELPRVDSIPYADAQTAVQGALEYDKSLSPYYQLLSGQKWQFALRDSNAQFTADSTVNGFFAADYDDSAWNSINVPSVWQLQTDENGERYDDIRYFNTTIPWSDDPTGNSTASAPLAPTVYNPVGLYRHSFTVPADWDGRRVYIHFDGAGSCMYLWINGHEIGYSEDMFTAKEFDITDYVNFGGENVIAVKVIRWSDGSWLENQDFFRLSGIFRDVYLFSTPQVRLRDFSVSTSFDENYSDAVLEVKTYVTNESAAAVGGYQVEISLYDDETGKMELSDNLAVIGTLQGGQEAQTTFAIPVPSPKVWNAETPNLYTVVIALKDEQGNVLSNDSYRVGFREITYRLLADGSYGVYSDCLNAADWEYDSIRINGQPILFKGVNRHEIEPSMGYAVDKATMEKDVLLMKQYNINALRTSHYPNNPYMYWLCDKYGIYVMDEANQEASGIYGKPAITEYFSDAIKDRADNMIYRDRNHASVVIWSYGNESGLGPDASGILYQMGDYVHALDDSRPVQYEPFDSDNGGEYKRDYTVDEAAGGVDMKSTMYRSVEYMEAYGKSGSTMPFIQCEYCHAMGNALGGFAEYWDTIRKYDNLQGGFIWDFIDQGIYTTKEVGGEPVTFLGYAGDFGKTSSYDCNFCANGIVFADRTPTPKTYEVQRLHQNLQFEAQDLAAGQIKITN